MRQYTLVFMEQHIGAVRPAPLAGTQGATSFAAVDDEAALAHITTNFVERLKACAHGELSSMQILEDATVSSGIRLVDDSHSHPQFQDTYVKFNAATKTVEVDWESTRTLIIAGPPPLRA